MTTFFASVRSRLAHAAFHSSLVAASTAVVLAATSPARSQEADIAALVEAGEFGPAIELARQESESSVRDAWFERIGLAQAQAGARLAAVSTASRIDNDLSRYRVLSAPVAPTRPGAFGGNPFAEEGFVRLMDLIRTTVAPASWDDLGGPGAMMPFPGGVYVDASGLMQRRVEPDNHVWLASLRRDAAPMSVGQADVRRTAQFRKVSLTRLEKQAQLRLAAGQPLDDAMRSLAGLQRIDSVFVYPESGELVIAGPAGDWTLDPEGRAVGRETGAAVLQLDDLVVMLREARKSGALRFTAAIVPTAEGLARAQQFAARQAGTPLKPGQKSAWLEKLRQELGPQDLEVQGLDPRSRAAHVLLEADYRMKLVGIGLERGALGVPSYFDIVAEHSADAPAALGVLRWWFTLGFDGIAATPERDAFAFKGQAVKLKSENELLTETGQRIHTGDADQLNREYAQRFTQHFDAMARMYPVYGDLRGVFELAMLAALIESERLDQRVGWNQTCFGNPADFPIFPGETPRTIESVVNHRVINRKQILTAVSGGVRCDTSEVIARNCLEIDTTGRMQSDRERSHARELPADAWWWD